MPPTFQHPPETLIEAVQQLLRQCTGNSTALQAAVLYTTAAAPLPRWLELCICVMSGIHCSEAQAKVLRKHLLSSDLHIAPQVSSAFNHDDNHPPLSAGRVAALAATAWRPAGVEPAEPQDACEALLVRALQGRLLRPALDMTQLLIGGVRGPEDNGVLARLRLWSVPPDDHAAPTPPRPAGSGPCLVRAPGAVLLPVDTSFGRGLSSVQALMDHVLWPTAPDLAWDLAPLSERAGAAQDMPAITGASASATLAYGALWVLRDHLKPEHADVRALLNNSEPDQVSVTAELGPVAPAGQPFTWPALAQINGFDDKFSALNRLPTGRKVTHLFVAAGQACNAAALPAHEAGTLLDLVTGVAQHANGGLTPEAGQLHALLMAADRPAPPAALLRAVAGQQPTTVKGYLLQRYAVRAGGEHSPFGAPARLGRHFVKLELEPEPQPDEDADLLGRESVPHETAAQGDQHPELQDLLTGEPYADVQAWLITADPLAGKTTLLAAWEMNTALAALRRGNRREPWGEVCVFLPMRGFAECVQRYSSQGVAAAFEAFVAQHGKGLPPAARLLSGTSPEKGLQLRLLLDALNEISTPTLAERARLVGQVCDWLATPKAAGTQLAPVFSVRERENGLTLAATPANLNLHWRARTARLRAWGRAEMRRYVDKRGLPPVARSALGLALGLDEADTAPLKPLASFCSAPGILAAQCTLLQRWPTLAPPGGRGPLFLALLWHQLLAHADDLPDSLLPDAMREEFSRLGSGARWPLPPEPGVLLQQLAAQASAMHDGAGGSTDDVALAGVPPGLQATGDAPLRQAWLQAVRTLGLAWADARRFGYTHQQWREFFGALHLDLSDDWPDLSPPPLDPPDEAALLRQFKQDEGAWLRLPTVTPHYERVRFAASMSYDVPGWLQRVLPHNLALAARLAIDHRGALEDLDTCGFPKGTFHPLLQHLRRELLLRSVDAGAVVKDRLRAGGVLQALEEPIAHLPAALKARWREVYGEQGARAFESQGVDIRQRLEAGLLLGDLGDTLRYERVQVEVARADGGSETRVGLRLKARHWVAVGEAGRRTKHRIGDAQGKEPERPEWEAELEHFHLAGHAVTVGEYRYFVAGSGYEPGQPWWGPAKGAARWWLEKRDRRQPWLWQFQLLSNSLQPMVGLAWWEARAYARWAEALHAGQGGRVRLPTEVQWEAAARSPQAPGGPRPRWPHGDPGPQGQALAFNHVSTRWMGPSPVGVFSLGLNAGGAADLAGNASDWCSSVAASLFSYDSQAGRDEAETSDELTPSTRALRGGGFDGSADLARAGYRGRSRPDYGNNDFGLRLVRA